MQEVTWQSVIPQFTQFEKEIEQYPLIATTSLPTQTQDKLSNALTRLITTLHYPHFLLLNAPDTYDYHALIKQMVQTLSPNQDMPVLNAEHFDELSLFGALYFNQNSADPSSITKVHGLLHHAHNGIIIISLTELLQNPPHVWLRLKQTISQQRLYWKNAKYKDNIPTNQFDPLLTKVILLGDRNLIAQFEEIEPYIHQQSIYGEYEQDLLLSTTNIQDYLAFIHYFQKQLAIKPLSSCAIKPLLQAGARFSEDNRRIPLCPLWLKELLTEANHQSSIDIIDKHHIQKALTQKIYRAAYLPLCALDDIDTDHVLIETQGEKIGQINALTVIEISGHPITFGEPVRISCVVHFGDGEITDVERKAELAGNIHAKGMMIMQAFIHCALDLNEPLPYSASIVFEQSYCEVDGDSASLAELCVLVSALSQQPISQEIALTGAVDQFGNVLAIGGINEKIEGFFSICKQRGLSGKQGVILPKANLNSICLNNDVADAIKNEQFHLWAIEHAKDAFPLLSGLLFDKEDDNDDEEETLLDKIAHRIETFHHGEARHNSILNKIKNWLN